MILGNVKFVGIFERKGILLLGIDSVEDIWYGIKSFILSFLYRQAITSLGPSHSHWTGC